MIGHNLIANENPLLELQKVIIEFENKIGYTSFCKKCQFFRRFKKQKRIYFWKFVLKIFISSKFLISI